VSALSGQQPTTAVGRIAFRVAPEGVIAVLRVLPERIAEERSTPVVAKYGFAFFEPPESLAASVAPDVHPGDPWIVHTGPGRTVDAAVERIVGGNAGCNGALGVLLKVAAAHIGDFSRVPANYFIAEPQKGSQGLSPAVAVSVAALPESTVTMEMRRTAEARLSELLKRELPNIVTESEGELARMASSPVDYQRSFARQRQTILQGLARGGGRLSYDVQAFRLTPDGTPFYFVRATWRVDGRQAFAAAVWMRGEDLEIVRSDLRPASWLTMFEFQGTVSNEQLGLVLNVLDRDHDGWGEVLFAQGGYESLSIEEFRFSPTDGATPGATYSYGC
jgi:hypothetical protein